MRSPRLSGIISRGSSPSQKPHEGCAWRYGSGPTTAGPAPLARHGAYPPPLEGSPTRDRYLAQPSTAVGTARPAFATVKPDGHRGVRGPGDFEWSSGIEFASGNRRGSSLEMNSEVRL